MKFPSKPAREAAVHLVDFETSNGLNMEFLTNLVENTSSEAEAVKEIGGFIDRTTNLPELIKAVEWLLYGCLTDREVIVLAEGKTNSKKVANRADETKKARQYAMEVLAKAKG